MANLPRVALWLALLSLVVLLSGCSAVAGIFKAGVWTGVVLIIVVALLIVGAFSLVRRS